MWVNDLVQAGLFFALILFLTPIFGTYIAKVFEGNALLPYRLLGWLEQLCYRISGVDSKEAMTWKIYAKNLILFNFFGFIFCFIIQLIQAELPLNPQKFPSVPLALAFNTAASFVTNTNYQSYAGETAMSYLTQMMGLTPQNFLSAATGLSALMVLIRGLTKSSQDSVGNFWEDFVRSIVYILLPLSFIVALIFVSEGVIQTFDSYVEVTTLEGAKQIVPLGPVASQVAIKQIGTNGGGFFNANSAHPFENPSFVTLFLEMLMIVLIPIATVYAFGIMIISKSRGWFILLVMASLFFLGLGIALYSEFLYNPVLEAYPILEGKETRFGITNTSIWTVLTTATSNGSVNSSISSLSPLGSFVAICNMMLGELVFGGIGVGLGSMLMFIILTVFLSGLMVGRTPEYLGKKIGKQEMQWVIMAVLVPSALILIGAGITTLFPQGISNFGKSGPHGLSEILYAFTSTAANNGSSFASLDTNTDYYNIVLGSIMLITRLSIILPMLAIGGLLAKKNTIPPSAGTFSTNSLLFSSLLLGVILIVGALTFFPALSLGPILEHFLMLEGRSF